MLPMSSQPSPSLSTREINQCKRLTSEQRHTIVNLTLNNRMSAAPDIMNMMNVGDVKITDTAIYGVIRTFRKHNRIESKKNAGRKRKWTDECQQLAEEIQDNCSTKTYRQILDELFDATGEDFAISTISKKLLNAPVRFTTKTTVRIPIERNTPSLIASRAEYCKEAARWEVDEILFLDETGFNLHLARHRGRSRIGTRATVVQPSSKGANITVVAALSPKRGLVHWKSKLGSFCAPDYAEFVRECLRLPALQLYSHRLIQDNASIHHCAAVKEALEDCKVDHVQRFLPAYSPQLNPIEECFSKWKMHVKLNEKRNGHQLLNLIAEGAARITAEDADGWYRHSMRYYVQCAAGEPLI